MFVTLSFGIDTETTGPNYPLSTFNLNLLAKITPRSILHPLFHPDYQHTPLHPIILTEPRQTYLIVMIKSTRHILEPTNSSLTSY